jgi:hypothetical protein
MCGRVVVRFIDPKRVGSEWLLERRRKGMVHSSMQFNVTDLTYLQKRRIFVNCFSESGFVAFNKKKALTKPTTSSSTRAE